MQIGEAGIPSQVKCESLLVAAAVAELIVVFVLVSAKCFFLLNCPFCHLPLVDSISTWTFTIHTSFPLYFAQSFDDRLQHDATAARMVWTCWKRATSVTLARQFHPTVTSYTQLLFWYHLSNSS